MTSLLRKNIISYKPSSNDDIQSFYHAVTMDLSLRDKHKKEEQRLKVKSREMTVEQLT